MVLSCWLFKLQASNPEPPPWPLLRPCPAFPALRRISAACGSVSSAASHFPPLVAFSRFLVLRHIPAACGSLLMPSSQAANTGLELVLRRAPAGMQRRTFNDEFSV
ncbi:hypothetical protein DFH09DRAFT_1369726 [Mycena vulgaris]|nr:hypothetical protein DFH09DRAFT_1369726 [Mycena vulgaris]